MNKFISNINDISFTLKLNLFRFNPCKEWIYLKLKFKGLYVDFHELCMELARQGITDEQLAENMKALYDISIKNASNDRKVEIAKRYVEKKRFNEGADSSF